MTDPSQPAWDAALLERTVDRLPEASATVRRLTVGENTLLVELHADGPVGGDVETAGDGPGTVNCDIATSGTRSGRTLAGVAHRPPGPDPTLDGRVPTVEGMDAHDLARWSFHQPVLHDQDDGQGGGDDEPDGEPVRDGGAGEVTGVELAESARVRYRAPRAIGLAALNALSEPHVPWRRGDPFATIGSDLDAVATVGLFRAALKRFGARDVRVVEREAIHPATVDAPRGVEVRTYTPEQADTAFEGVDAVFITGSTLVYGGLETYMRAATEVPIVVLVGATASFLPEPVFDAGVTTLAGARVTDLEGVRAAVERGACGSALHESGLEKVYVERTS